MPRATANNRAAGDPISGVSGAGEPATGSNFTERQTLVVGEAFAGDVDRLQKNQDDNVTVVDAGEASTQEIQDAVNNPQTFGVANPSAFDKWISGERDTRPTKAEQAASQQPDVISMAAAAENQDDTPTTTGPDAKNSAESTGRTAGTDLSEQLLDRAAAFREGDASSEELLDAAARFRKGSDDASGPNRQTPEQGEAKGTGVGPLAVIAGAVLVIGVVLGG